MSIASTSVIQIIPRTRRGVELLLLVIAIAVSVGAYVEIGNTVQNAVPASTGAYAAGITLLALSAHFALRSRSDLGLALVAEANGRTPKPPAAPQQITWTAVGIVLFLVVILVIRDH